MDAAALKTEPLAYLRSVLRRVNPRHPEKVARLIDSQLPTADRISSAYTLLEKARREKREPTAFERALARDAVKCIQRLDLRKLRLPFWWKYGTLIIIASLILTSGTALAGYQWITAPQPALPVSSSHLSSEIQALRGVAVELGEAVQGAKEGNLAQVGEGLIGAANYLEMLARTLGSSELVAISALIKKAGAELKEGKLGEAGKDLTQAGSLLEGLKSGDISWAEAGEAFTEAGRLLSQAAESPASADLKKLGIGLANDLLEAREVIMNAASKLEFYEDEEILKSVEKSLASGSKEDLLKAMGDLGQVLRDLNAHLVQQSLPLMERNIPWQDLTNLEKMTSGWDDTWPYYVPAAKVPSDLSKSPGASDPALSPADAKELFRILSEASKAIASASQNMELMRVKGNPEDLQKIAQDLAAAEMALKEASKLARAVAANYITSIKLNVPTQFEDVTNPTATCVGPAWIYQQQEPNMGVTDLWKMRYVSSYYGSLGIAGDQLGSAGEMLGSAFGMWNKGSDMLAMRDLKLGEEHLVGALRQVAMTLGNYEELKELQSRMTAVESYSQVIRKMEEQLPALEKATTPEAGLKALSAEMAALAQPFSTTPMYKPDVYYLLDEAGRKLGLAATQTGVQQQASIQSAAQNIDKASDILFGAQEINLREFGQFLEDIASQLSSTTASKGGQYFLGPLRKVALDLRGLQELMGVQVKWERQAAREMASELDRTLVMGTVLLRPVSGDEKAPSPNLSVAYYIEAPAAAKSPQLRYSGELLAVPVVDSRVAEMLSFPPTASNLTPERLPTSGTDIISRYFLSLAREGSTVKNWIKKEVPVKPGQPHITVPPLPPDMPPRQPPSTGGGLNCPAVSGK